MILVNLISYSLSANITSKGRVLQTTSCPSVSFAESYSTTYKLSTFIITPTYNLNCGTGKVFTIASGLIINANGLNYNVTSK